VSLTQNLKWIARGQIKSSFIREILLVNRIILWNMQNWPPARAPLISHRIGWRCATSSSNVPVFFITIYSYSTMSERKYYRLFTDTFSLFLLVFFSFLSTFFYLFLPLPPLFSFLTPPSLGPTPLNGDGIKIVMREIFYHSRENDSKNFAVLARAQNLQSFNQITCC